MKTLGSGVRYGLLADIHEHVEFLRAAIGRCRDAGVSEFIVLGDIFRDGRRIDDTVSLLLSIRSRGVWGNHDFGLCVDPEERVARRYDGATMRYFSSLRPRIEFDGVLVQHIMPHRDPSRLEDLWQGGNDAPDTRSKAAPCFECCEARLMLLGHYHRWLAATPEHHADWIGERPISLPPEYRWLVVVDAVENGCAAVLDTDEWVLEPLDLTSD